MIQFIIWWFGLVWELFFLSFPWFSERIPLNPLGILYCSIWIPTPIFLLTRCSSHMILTRHSSTLLLSQHFVQHFLGRLMGVWMIRKGVEYGYGRFYLQNKIYLVCTFLSSFAWLGGLLFYFPVFYSDQYWLHFYASPSRNESKTNIILTMYSMILTF